VSYGHFQYLFDKRKYNNTYIVATIIVTKIKIYDFLNLKYPPLWNYHHLSFYKMLQNKYVPSFSILRLSKSKSIYNFKDPSYRPEC